GPSACAGPPRPAASSWRQPRTLRPGQLRPCSSWHLGRVWRRRMGVEPTRDRLTAPPGFEVRSPHRERDSSVFLPVRPVGREELDTRRIDAPQILAADREAVAIEELENLYGHLAAVVQTVAEIGRREFALRRLRGEID